MILNDYIGYFRNLAVTHSAIQHNPASESGDGPRGSMRFASYNASDVITKRLRTKVGFPALLTEIFEVDTAGSSVLDVKAGYIGALMVLDHAKSNDYADEIAKLASTELIIWQLINQMWQDHYGPDKSRCTSPFASISFNKLNVVAVGPLFDNEFGWRCEFQFQPKLPFDLKKPVLAGVFVNP